MLFRSAELTRDFGSAAWGAALPDATAGLPACIGPLSFLGAAAFGGAMVAGKERSLEAVRFGKKEAFGGSMRWRNGRSDGRHHRAQLYRPVTKDVAGPLESRRSWLGAQPLRPTCHGPGRHRWAPDASPASAVLGVPIVGPGATVGTVETRVPRAGLPGPTTSSRNITKDQALQAW